MNCSKCQKLSDEATRGKLTERLDHKVRDHLESCPACSVYYQENEALRRLLRESAAPPAMPDEAWFRRLARRAVEEAEGGRAAAPAPSRPGLFDWLIGGPALGGLARATTVLAVGVFVGFVVSQMYFAGPDLEPNGPIAYHTPTPKPVPPTPRTVLTPNPTVQPEITPTIVPVTVSNGNPAPGVEQFPPGAPIEKVPGTVAAVDPQLVLTTFNQAMDFIKSVPPTEEYEGLRRIRQVTRQVDAGTVLTSLQDLKIQLIQNGQASYVPVVHQIEGLVNEMALAAPESRRQHFAHLGTYQEAESAILDKDPAKRDYDKAMRLFQTVVIQAPESYFAALAKYEMGNINFEHYRQYKDALVDYSQCLEESDPKFLTPKIIEQIHERVQLITQSSMDNYAPLHMFYDAQSTNDRDEALELYKSLIQKYPQSALVERAIEELVKGVQRTPNNRPLVNEMVEVFDQFQQQNPDHPLRLYAQLGIADMIHSPLRNRAQAKIDYGKILQETKDLYLTKVLQDRLNQIDAEQ